MGDGASAAGVQSWGRSKWFWCATLLAGLGVAAVALSIALSLLLSDCAASEIGGGSQAVDEASGPSLIPPGYRCALFGAGDAVEVGELFIWAPVLNWLAAALLLAALLAVVAGLMRPSPVGMGGGGPQ